MRRFCLFFSTTVAAVAVLSTYGLPVEAIAKPYYQGKTITVIIGLGASSGGTTMGRVISKHMSKAIAGNPKLVIKNMPGAAFMKAHQYVLKSAPKDGTVVYYGPRKPIGELLRAPGHDFKYTDFSILGGIQVAGLVVVARSDVVDGGAKSVSDLLKSSSLKYGGLSPEHSRMLLCMQAMDLLGMKYRFVPGYRGSGKIRAALFKGEVNLATDAAHAFRNKVVPRLVKKKAGFGAFHIPVLAKNGSLMKNKLVPDVPYFLDVYKKIKGGMPSGEKWEVMKTLIKVDQTMQHVYMGPPGMNQKAAAAFRKAIVPALATEAFKKDAMKILTYVPGAVEYNKAQQIIASTKDVPASVVKYLKNYIAKHTK